MSTALPNDNDYNVDEEEDNESDAGEWLEKNKNVSEHCPVIVSKELVTVTVVAIVKNFRSGYAVVYPNVSVMPDTTSEQIY